MRNPKYRRRLRSDQEQRREDQAEESEDAGDDTEGVEEEDDHSEIEGGGGSVAPRSSSHSGTSSTSSRHVRIQVPPSSNNSRAAANAHHRRSFSWSSSSCSSSQSPLLEPGAVSAEEEEDRTSSSDYSSHHSPRASTCSTANSSSLASNNSDGTPGSAVTSAFRQMGSSFAGKTLGSTYSNYSDLAARLRHGLQACDENAEQNPSALRRNQSEVLSFDENVVGTDVVLCVYEDPHGHGVAVDAHSIHGRTPPSPSPSLSSLASLSPLPSFTTTTSSSSSSCSSSGATSIIPVVSQTPPTSVAATATSTTPQTASSSSLSVKPPTVVTRLYAHRFMLASSSEPFRVMLTGRMREANENEVHMYDLCATVVKKMLAYIYTGEVTLTMDDVVETLMASEMYELAGLKEICKSFVLQNAQELFTGDRIVRLPEKLLLEIVQDDNLQIREVVLLDALVTWGQARATTGTSVLEILADLMDHVRFPTMSVNDLYGKVRPLAQEGVLKESLLTEALFHHLKWGLHAGQAFERSRPRALATQLRKRKRVSFFQHVSFLPQ